ncbi:Ig-like domain-containing protein [Dyadobacter aurulentus]|uniref:Ig-like domain-containing protein n=1 Tax=Dyadobacter sp. UC 10 TaxID=2605428 RepID=UPI0011F240EE|nr:Ig-like domain-containing protein [Dyadobacter sp. UC 10]KAA0992145.1 T9SS type A sorting domain-containing protein [Dyadobacter sp. UC 10]
MYNSTVSLLLYLILGTYQAFASDLSASGNNANPNEGTLAYTEILKNRPDEPECITANGQPVSLQDICAGSEPQQLVFEVASEETVTYTWYFTSSDGTIVDEEVYSGSENSYTPASDQFGTFYCIASAECGNIQSDGAVVQYVTAGTISGESVICAAPGSEPFIYTVAGATSAGEWSSSNPSIASIDAQTGELTVHAKGAVTIQYAISSGCYPVSDFHITINYLDQIAGNLTACLDGTEPQTEQLSTQLSTEGGAWSSSNPAVASIDEASGLVTPLAAGTTTISYKLATCATSIEAEFTVYSAGTISGPDEIQIGGASAPPDPEVYQFSVTAATPGGVWTSSDTEVVTVDETGLLTMLRAGTSVITYTLNTSCGTIKTSKTVTILTPGQITGSSVICNNGTVFQFEIENGTAGGIWSTTSPDIATIDQNGVVTPQAVGLFFVYYKVGNRTAQKTVVIMSAGLLQGPRAVCINSPSYMNQYYLIEYTDNGTWASSNPAVATIDEYGTFVPVSAGTTIISYTVTSPECGTLTTTQVLSVESPDNSVTRFEGYQVMTEGVNNLISDCSIVGTLESASIYNSEYPYFDAAVWLENGSTVIRVSPYGDFNQPASVVLYFTQQDFDAFNFKNSVRVPKNPTDISGKANLRILHFSGMGSPSELIDPTTITWNAAATRWEIAFSITHFSTFSIAAEATALPVTLASFKVEKQEHTAKLTWISTSEVNSDYYEVQHSRNGKNWQKLDIVSSGGDSDAENRYSYLHVNPANGANLYRLKMVDRDLSFAYSKIQTVTFERVVDVIIFPNPTSGQITINTPGWELVKSVKIYNLVGSVVYTSEKRPAKIIDVSNVNAGNYLIQLISQDGSVRTERIVISK